MSCSNTAGFLLLILLWVTVYLAHFPFLGASESLRVEQSSRSFNSSWYPPNKTQINDLEAVINGTAIFGFVFSDAYAAPEVDGDGTQNWCNMPHVNSKTYLVPPTGYTWNMSKWCVPHPHHLAWREIKISRSTDITNAPLMLPIPFLENLVLGTAMMRACLLMANL